MQFPLRQDGFGTRLENSNRKGNVVMTEQKKPHRLQIVHSQTLLAPEGTVKYVRVTERMANGFIAFDFAIGSPDLFVELILPEAAFDVFCKANNAVTMTKEQSDIVDREMKKWRYGEEGMDLKRSAKQRRETDSEGDQ